MSLNEKLTRLALPEGSCEWWIVIWESQGDNIFKTKQKKYTKGTIDVLCFKECLTPKYLGIFPCYIFTGLFSFKNNDGFNIARFFIDLFSWMKIIHVGFVSV